MVIATVVKIKQFLVVINMVVKNKTKVVKIKQFLIVVIAVVKIKQLL